MKPALLKEGGYKIFCMPHPKAGTARPHPFAMCSDGQLQEVLALVKKHEQKLRSAWNM